MNYSIEYLEKLLKAVDLFEVRFTDWMTTQVELDHNEARGIFPTVHPKDEVSASQIDEKELALAEAAGLACAAIKVTGAYIAVAGMGLLDPIANWSMMSQPKALLAPRDIRLTVANVKGRLEGMISDAAACESNDIPPFSPANLHPLIWKAAAPQWTIHQYRVAVSEAAGALTNYWRDRLGRKDVDGTKFWQQSLSPEPPVPGKPRLVWPGDPSDKTVKGMKSGLPMLTVSLKDLAAGLCLVSRNASAHAQRIVNEQEGMEQLAAYSFLARLLDRCEILSADDMPSSSGDGRES